MNFAPNISVMLPAAGPPIVAPSICVKCLPKKEQLLLVFVSSTASRILLLSATLLSSASFETYSTASMHFLVSHDG